MSAIQNYDLGYLKACVEKNHPKLKVLEISETDCGLDNSVYFLQTNQGKYVLKIIETKDKEQIANSIQMSSQLGSPYCKIDYLTAQSGNYLFLLDEYGKHAFVYKYLEGKQISFFSESEVEAFAKFVSDFHSLKREEVVSTRPLVGQEFKLLDFYFSYEVQSGTKEFTPERYQVYVELMEYINKHREYLQSSMLSIPIFKGLSHGDLNPENVLIANDSLTMIDFDGISMDGVQLYDLLQAFVKSDLMTNLEYSKIVIKAYFQNADISQTLASLKAWGLIFAVRAALSTEYYTYNIPKLSPEWNIQNASTTIDMLLNNAMLIKKEGAEHLL